MKYTVTLEERSFEVTERVIGVEADFAPDAHKKALSHCNKYEEITLIKDSNGIVVYSEENGFN